MDHEPDWISLSEEERRLLASWVADCAERVLPLFEAKAPSDARSREAIEGARAYARGGKRTARLRSLALAALAAAREVGEPCAAAAARAAGLAASFAYIHEKVAAEQAKHALGPPAYAARARELAQDAEAGAADEEIRWAVAHASPQVLEAMRRMPVRDSGRGRLGALMLQIDAGLRL